MVERATRDDLATAMVANFAKTYPEVAGSRAAAKRAIEAVVGSIETLLVKRGAVDLRGFGSLRRTILAARNGRNPATGEAMRIGQKTVVRFKAGRPLLERLNAAKKRGRPKAADTEATEAEDQPADAPATAE